MESPLVDLSGVDLEKLLARGDDALTRAVQRFKDEATDGDRDYAISAFNSYL